jgi:hypothetical protein
MVWGEGKVILHEPKKSKREKSNVMYWHERLIVTNTEIFGKTSCGETPLLA